jgi:hypothetical protein
MKSKKKKIKSVKAWGVFDPRRIRRTNNWYKSPWLVFGSRPRASWWKEEGDKVRRVTITWEE